MNEERFAALAAAWGADLRRWPAAEREAAEAWRASAPQSQTLLAEADRTDALLWGSPAAAPSPALMQRVIAAAPTARPVSRLRAWLAGAGVGASLAVACAAGVAVGGLLAPQLTALDAPRDAHAGIPDEAVADLADGWDAG